MFATFTDWEFSDMDAMVSTGTAMWPQVQAAGALSFTAIDGLRATAMEMTDTKATAMAAGEVMLDFG